MDRTIVDRKLETLRRCLMRIESWTPKTQEDLEMSVDAQDIVSVNLERAVQACVDIASHILSHREGPIPDTTHPLWSLLKTEEVNEKVHLDEDKSTREEWRREVFVAWMTRTRDQLQRHFAATDHLGSQTGATAH